jgi:hypothetical protein
MLLNHARKSPVDWDDALPSLCPDCGASLIPRRGRVVIWHWAHRGQHHGAAGGAVGCDARETFWHAAWKSVYHQFPGWDIEVPLALNGKRYRLDAARLSRSKAREFVHSLSEGYVAKHLDLRASGLDVLWIYDGGTFAARRRRPIRGGGLKHLLKPKARWLHARVGGLVHHGGALWREWKADCWYPLESDLTQRLVAAFDRFAGALTAAGPGAEEGGPTRDARGAGDPEPDPGRLGPANFEADARFVLRVGGLADDFPDAAAVIRRALRPAGSAAGA